VATVSPHGSIGVLDVDGLRLADRPLVPITGTIRHVGDLYKGARRHGLTQLWLTDAWVRAAQLPDTLAVSGPFRELRHPFVSDGLDELHAFPTALTPWLDLRKKGEAGLSVSIVFPLYDEHAVWGLDTDGATLLAALLAYAQAVGAPYYRSPGRTSLDLLQELGKRGADAKRAFPERLPVPAGQADTVTELSWLRTLAPAERGKAYLHSYDKNAQWLSAAGVVELGLSGIEERRDPAGTLHLRQEVAGLLAGTDLRRGGTVGLHADGGVGAGAWPGRRDHRGVRLDHTQPGDGDVVRAAARGADGALRRHDVGGTPGARRAQVHLRAHDQRLQQRVAARAAKSPVPAGLAPPHHRASQRQHVAGVAQDGRGGLYARRHPQGRRVPRERRARSGGSVPTVGDAGDRPGTLQGAGRGDPAGAGAAGVRRHTWWWGRYAVAAPEAAPRRDGRTDDRGGGVACRIWERT